MSIEELAQALARMDHEQPDVSQVVSTMLFGIRYEEQLRPLSKPQREVIVLKGLPGASLEKRLYDIRQGERLARYVAWQPASTGVLAPSANE